MKKKKRGGVTPAHELQAKQKFNDDFVRQTLSSLKFCVSRYVCERNRFLYRCCFLIALHLRDVIAPLQHVEKMSREEETVYGK